jgi:hypothetical protein
MFHHKEKNYQIRATTLILNDDEIGGQDAKNFSRLVMRSCSWASMEHSMASNFLWMKNIESQDEPCEC